MIIESLFLFYKKCECCRCDGLELESNNEDCNDLSYHRHKRAYLCLVGRALM